MFKLFVLAALLAVAAARPGHLAGAPLVYSAPLAHTTVVQEPTYAKVGAVVKSVPTAVSHQSLTQVHHSAAVVEDVVAPVAVKTTYTAPVAAAVAPVTTYAAAATPLVNTIAAGHQVAYTAPAVSTYAASPYVHSAPLAYAAPVSYAATYAAPAHYSAW